MRESFLRCPLIFTCLLISCYRNVVFFCSQSSSMSQMFNFTLPIFFIWNSYNNALPFFIQKHSKNSRIGRVTKREIFRIGIFSFIIIVVNEDNCCDDALHLKIWSNLWSTRAIKMTSNGDEKSQQHEEHSIVGRKTWAEGVKWINLNKQSRAYLFYWKERKNTRRLELFYKWKENKKKVEFNEPRWAFFRILSLCLSFIPPKSCINTQIQCKQIPFLSTHPSSFFQFVVESALIAFRL